MQDYTGALIDSCGRLKTSDVGLNTMHLDPVPDPEICSNLDPGPNLQYIRIQAFSNSYRT